MFYRNVILAMYDNIQQLYEWKRGSILEFYSSDGTVSFDGECGSCGVTFSGFGRYDHFLEVLCSASRACRWSLLCYQLLIMSSQVWMYLGTGANFMFACKAAIVNQDLTAERVKGDISFNV
jgi:hypothetical protein